jgi:hypothetical protein
MTQRLLLTPGPLLRGSRVGPLAKQIAKNSDLAAVMKVVAHRRRKDLTSWPTIAPIRKHLVLKVSYARAEALVGLLQLLPQELVADRATSDRYFGPGS